jgi:hypothetical protein
MGWDGMGWDGKKGYDEVDWNWRDKMGRQITKYEMGHNTREEKREGEVRRREKHFIICWTLLDLREIGIETGLYLDPGPICRY